MTPAAILELHRPEPAPRWIAVGWTRAGALVTVSADDAAPDAVELACDERAEAQRALGQAAQHEALIIADDDTPGDRHAR